MKKFIGVIDDGHGNWRRRKCGAARRRNEANKFLIDEKSCTYRMEHLVKLPAKKVTLLLLASLACASAHAAAMEDLSLQPFRQCRQPPKAPPHKMLHQQYRAENTSTNGPFDQNIDINGDGWCDWVSTAAMAPHRGDLDEPSMKDFIFLGTKTGWRTFGDAKKFGTDPDALSFSRPLLFAASSAASFIAPTIVYSKKTPAPYVAAISLNEDILDPNLGNVSVYQWDDNFDALRVVGEKDGKTVIEFLRNTRCKPGQKYGAGVSVAQAICGKQPELVK